MMSRAPTAPLPSPCPFEGICKPYLYISQMTTTAITTDNAALLAEFSGGNSSDIAMMIGIGLVKDSDAVFFQYMGEEQQPVALMLPASGKPLTRLANVRLTGIDIAEDVGEFKSTKLNLFLESSQGRTVMLTSGLNTLWSQCVLTGLVAVFNEYGLTKPLTIDSWKGKASMRPCFAAIRQDNLKMSDQAMYDALVDARADRDQQLIERIQRDAVAVLKEALGIEPASVDVEAADKPLVKGDF